VRVSLVWRSVSAPDGQNVKESDLSTDTAVVFAVHAVQSAAE